jgi:hypothetical protein
MPLAAPTLTVTLTTSLLGSGMIGSATPKFASGVAQGVTLWVKKLSVQTVDAGVAGVGTGLFPFLIPPQLLMANLLAAYVANGQIGPMAPLEAVGLANGLAMGLLTGLIKTTHPTVGAGAGVARISGPPAYSSLMQGFSSVGIKGQGATKKANAISTALMLTLQVITLPIPIVGPVGPSPSSGIGSGKIV